MDNHSEPLIGDRAAWVARSAFFDQDIYELEQERVFRRNWLFLGHESQVSKPRDFFTTYMGEESVIVTRDSAGVMRAFLNTCRHRGMRVCRADKGNTAAFTCSYHAWTYDTAGTLIGVPKFREAYHEEIDKADWGLLTVPRVETYKGLIFGNFDAGAVPLVEFLGDMAFYLDIVLDRTASGTELVGGIHKWLMPSNWKVACDNNSGDYYHVPFTHASISKIQPPRPNAPRPRDSAENFQVAAEPGHTLVVTLMESAEQAMRGQSPEVREYARSVLPEVLERLGPVRARALFIAGNIFPNCSWVPGSFTVRSYHPRGPRQMEVWSYCIVDKGAPAAVKAAMAREYTQRFGPSGMLEQDDGENWSQVSASSQSSLARTLEFNYQMGLGHEGFREDLPGQLGQATGELTHRSFYTRWADDLGLVRAPAAAAP